MNLAQYKTKNYDKIEFCSVVLQVMNLLDISEKTAFEIAFNKAKTCRIKTGFIKIMPDAWIQYKKFMQYSKMKFSFMENIQIQENHILTSIKNVDKLINSL